MDEVHAVKADHQKTIQLNEETGGWFLSYLQKEGAVAFEKMWQPLNMGKADILRQDRVIQPENVCFLFFAHNNQRF